MSKAYEELDYRETPLGALMLRRRRMISLGDLDIFEVKLGEEFLMSSLFHDAELALADLGLAEVNAPELDVVVGGLGLGYTAVAALKNSKVQSLLVIDFMEEVIEWHRRGLVPLGPKLTADPRCRLVQGDFFALAAAPERGFDPEKPGRRFHAVLLDIDHSPSNLLNDRNASFYEPEGLRRLAAHLHPGGVFALWSDEAPDPEFLERLSQVFPELRAQVVPFHNPLLRKDSSNTVYVARTAKK